MQKEDLEARCERAAKLHNQKLNCAQCAALDLSDLVGFDEDTIHRLAEGFGAGMGGRTQACGAISGGVMILSAALSDGSDDCASKPTTYKWVI